MKSAHNIQMLAEGQLSKTLWRLCLPTVAAMTINGVYNVVDAFFIGLTNDPGAIGAVSVIFPLFIVISALGIGVAVGAGSYISRCLGAGEMCQAQKAAGAAVILAIAIGLIATGAGFLWLKPLLYLLGAREGIMPYAQGYAFWILFGNVFVMLNSALAGAIRAEGNAAYATVSLLAGTLLNVALDPVFIFVFGLGIEGAAIATLISYAVTFMICAGYYMSKKAAVRIRVRFSDIDRQNMREMIRIGLPAMIKQLLLAVVFSVINMLSVAYGESAVTAAGICAKINSFAAMTLMGIAEGFMPVAAFNYGANQYKRVLGALRMVMTAALVFSAVSGAVYVIFGSEIVSLFCRDASVVATGSRFMLAFAVGVLPLGVVFVLDALFSACGRARSAMLLSLSRQGLIFLPVIFIAEAYAQLDGVIWASAIADVLCCFAVALPLALAFIKHLRYAQPDLNKNALDKPAPDLSL